MLRRLEDWVEPRRAAFLDRDGVVIEDGGYLCDPAGIRWIPGAVLAIRRLREAGFAPILATNQSGVGRGFFTQAALDLFHSALAARLAAMGAPLAAIAWCPHGPSEACDCRKPLPGMLEEALAALPLVREGSFMVGDRPGDLQAGEAAGVRGLLFEGGSLAGFLARRGVGVPPASVGSIAFVKPDRRGRDAHATGGTLPRMVFRDGLAEAARVLELFRHDEECLQACEAFAAMLAECFRNGGKAMAAGNGGSMADALHFAEELTGRFRNDRDPLPAMALGDPTHLTCVSNDYGFDHVFSRLVQAFGKPGDVLLLLSTSGNSDNLVLAAETARRQGVRVVGFLGKGGGRLRELCDLVVMAPGATSDRIQEVHMTVLHLAIENVEVALGV